MCDVSVYVLAGSALAAIPADEAGDEEGDDKLLFLHCYFTSCCYLPFFISVCNAVSPYCICVFMLVECACILLIFCCVLRVC